MHVTTYDEIIRFRAPGSLAVAVRAAAAHEGVKPSEWLRSAVRNQVNGAAVEATGAADGIPRT